MSEITSGECLNCRAAMAGPYCAACGQKAVAPHPTLHDVVHEATHEMLNVDGRVWRSIWLLLSRPGLLTREYWAGRRARYLAPLRLYLIFSVLAFATFGLEKSHDAQPSVERRTGQGEVVRPGDLGASARVLNDRTPEQVAQRARRVFSAWLPRLMLAMLPVWALLVMMVTRSAHRTYPEHLYFSLHANAAFFAAITADNLLGLLPWKWADTTGMWLGYIYIIWYGVVGIHLLYGGSWARAALRGLTVGALYVFILAVAILAMLLTAFLI